MIDVSFLEIVKIPKVHSVQSPSSISLMMNYLSKALIVALTAASASAFAPTSISSIQSSALNVFDEGKGTLGDASTAESGSTIHEDAFSFGAGTVIQGKTLRTWDIENPATERVQVSCKSGARPFHANVEYWHTPTYIPLKFKCYSEDGQLRPLNAVIETPKSPKTIACYNINSQEFPLQATVAQNGLTSAYEVFSKNGPGDHIQGGKVASYTLDASVNSVHVLIKTEERNMKATIELTQGPNNIKQSYEIYASVGYKTPFYAVIETPGPGNVVRIINENPLEFPFNAWVEPFKQGGSVGKMGWN